jgi:hypothetical protein
MEDEQALASEMPDTLKRAWEAPSVEELDFTKTEAAYAFIGAADLGLYSV